MIAAHRPPAIKGPLLGSLILAALSLSSRWTVLPLTPTTFTFVSVSTALCVIWLVLVSVSIARYGKRALWLLIGAPLVMWWPVLYALLWWTCRHGYECF